MLLAYLSIYLSIYLSLYISINNHIAGQKQDDQHERPFNSYVRIRDVALKTCQRRRIIGTSGERGSGISVLMAQDDDDEM